MVSITLSLLNCNYVIATELPDILKSNTEINIQKNKTNDTQFKNLILLPLEWDNKEHINNIISKYKDITNIIVCECLYIQAPFDKLLSTLITLSKAYSNLSILFVYKKRYIYQEKCMATLSKYFTITPIKRSEYYSEFQKNESYQMMTLQYISK